jgi:hypothetical protein
MSSPAGKRTIAGLHPAAPVFALVALAAAVTGIAFAAGTLVGIPGADGRFYACVNNSSGELRLVTSDDSCADHWTRVFWSQTGPPGPPGQTGPPGPQGEPGGGAEGVFSSSGFFQSTPLGSNYTEIGRMKLEPGKWLVSATATLANYKPVEWVPTGCLLGTSLNVDRERGFADLGGLGTGGSTQRMTISEAVEFDVPAAVTLGCFANVQEPNVQAFHVQFTAVRVEQLTVTRTSEP